MYRITLGNDLIYDPRIPECYLENPKLHQKANKVGTLSFRMYQNHAQYGQFVKLASVVSVYQDDQTLPMWRGRVLSTVMRTDKSMQIECEDLLAYLLDSVQRPFDFTGTVRDFLKFVLDRHNAQVTSDQQINIGTVTVTDPNNYIHRSSIDYLSSWDVIESRLIKTHGGYLRLRHEAGGMYLDYLKGTQADLPTAIQVIEYGENIDDITEEVSADETFTACIPLGAKIKVEDDTGEEIERRLTVESVNGGLDYIVNDAALAQYGWICAPVSDTTWDDVTMPENLLKKARDYLNDQGVKLKNTLTIKAVDLHDCICDDRIICVYDANGACLYDVYDENLVYDETLERAEPFRFLTFVRVQSTPHNISKTYLLTEKTTPLADPKGTTITLGGTELSLSDTALSGFKDAQNRIETVSGTVDMNAIKTESQIKDANSKIDDANAKIDYANGQIDNANAKYNEIAQTTLDLQSNMERTAKELISQMSATYTSTSSFEEYKEAISTQFTQSASAFSLQFDKLVSQISTLNGATNQQFSEIKKYIRFEDGNIILGRSDSPLTLKIQSDRISFILDNVEIAYFISGRLYVDNVEAITTLTVGNFAWLPRSNGNLSLKMIKPLASNAMAVWNVRTKMVWEEIKVYLLDADSKQLQTSSNENLRGS